MDRILRLGGGLQGVGAVSFDAYCMSFIILPVPTIRFVLTFVNYYQVYLNLDLLYSVGLPNNYLLSWRDSYS